MICEKDKRENVIAKAKTLFNREISIVEDIEKAEKIYIVGMVTPDMQKKITLAKETGVPMVKVNDNLLQEGIYEKMLTGKVRIKEKGWERT